MRARDGPGPRPRAGSNGGGPVGLSTSLLLGCLATTTCATCWLSGIVAMRGSSRRRSILAIGTPGGDSLDSVERWGAKLYGNPCRDCGYDWSVSPRAAIAQVAELPEWYAAILADHSGTERHPGLGWTPAGYVSHVTDNLRNWAERLAGARLAGAVEIPGYDPDLLAEARHYNDIPLAAAMWSLRGAVDSWVESVSAALDAGVVLRHATRGIQRAEDVARNNAHDAAHHGWDIQRILRAG